MTVVEEFLTKELESFSLKATAKWTPLGGAFRGIAAPVYYSNNLYAFTRNINNSLGICTVSPSGTTGSWMQLGGTLLSSPAAAIAPNGTVAVIARMQGNTIQINYVNPLRRIQTGFSNFSGGTPSTIRWDGSPVLVANTDQRLEAFSLDSDGKMWHCYQTSAGPNPEWSHWSILGKDFLVGTSFQVFLNNNTGFLQAVAIGNDNKIYQMTQGERGGRNNWSAKKQVGNLPTTTLKFTVGTAAAYDINTTNPAYCGLNSDIGINAGPLMYSAVTESSLSGVWSNISGADAPIATSAPVMVSISGVPQLVVQTSSVTGQVNIFSADFNVPGFWKTQAPVADPESDLSGRMSGIVTNGSVALFQNGAGAGQLFYCNYSPR